MLALCEGQARVVGGVLHARIFKYIICDVNLTLKSCWHKQAKQKLSSSISDPVLGVSTGLHGRPAHNRFTVSCVSALCHCLCNCLGL